VRQGRESLFLFTADVPKVADKRRPATCRARYCPGLKAREGYLNFGSYHT